MGGLRALVLNGTLVVDASEKENSLDYAIECKLSVWKDLKELKKLSEAGYPIVWSKNERWCVVNGKTFNISKSVYTKRVIDSELEEIFNDYTWGVDGRHEIQVIYDCTGNDYEVAFDAAYDDFDEFLKYLK